MSWWTFRDARFARSSGWTFALAGAVLIAALLRYPGLHSPMLDHPNWRQGDEASIARNFAQLQFNPLFPQTNYDGPPPNYVELELQIVPFLAATLYKIAGVHEVFGRLIAIAFSLATVALLGFFARWLYGSWIAGVSAALLFAIVPGSIYYGRTFTPDIAMVFFLVAALYASARYLTDDEVLEPRALLAATALLTLAYLAKPVAVAALVPLAAMIWRRARSGRTFRVLPPAVLVVVPLVILAIYDRAVDAHAEWHWASGITRLHVLPSLVAAVSTTSGFALKAIQFARVLWMLVHTMLGTTGAILGVAGAIALPWLRARAPELLWGWLFGGLAYAYVVVTVERVDYYLLLLVPAFALLGAGLIARGIEHLVRSRAALALRYAAAVTVLALLVATVHESRAAIAPYYVYNKQAYRNAIALDRTLDPGALVVMGHYGPDVLYYINRYGWEEDPYLWTPFDEESAIRKGARYFISIEDNRLRHNLELCAWLQRFPVINPDAQWPVYETDLAKMKPGAESFWRAFRVAEHAGQGRAFLDARHVCERRDL